jgi:hypothetical protein
MYKFFFKWEQLIFSQYKNLFNKGTKSEDLRIGQVTMNEKWQWISMVDRLSDGDITKHSEIYEMNYVYCLNILSYWYERDTYNESINNIRKRHG